MTGCHLVSMLLLWLGLAVAPALRAQTAPACPPPLPAATVDAVQALHDGHDHGLLWRLRRDDRTSYLYGTMHVGRPPWGRPGPRVAAALRTADMLALELDIGDPAVQRDLAASVFSRPQALTPTAAQREQLRRQTEAACLPPDALAPLHPLMQAVTLTLLDARWIGLDASWGQEMILAASARRSHQPVASLESVATQVGSLIPDDPRRAGALLDQTLRQLGDPRSRQVLRRLAEAWAAGRLDELESYEAWCECIDGPDDRAELRRMIDGRNPALASAIASLHAQGRRVFAAVGALHMTGPLALPRLLQQLGFEVERVVFDP